jgi:hypothetical protein
VVVLAVALSQVCPDVGAYGFEDLSKGSRCLESNTLRWYFAREDQVHMEFETQVLPRGSVAAHLPKIHRPPGRFPPDAGDTVGRIGVAPSANSSAGSYPDDDLAPTPRRQTQGHQRLKRACHHKWPNPDNHPKRPWRSN